MEVRTGVAQGEATNADDPPNKNVRNNALLSLFVSVSSCRGSSSVLLVVSIVVVVVFVRWVTCRPEASSSIGPLFVFGQFAVPVVDVMVDGTAVANNFWGSKNVKDGKAMSIKSNNFNPMIKQTKLDKIGNIMVVVYAIAL